MAARKKKAPARKTAPRKAPAAKKRAKPRALPNDDAWRKLIETAVEAPLTQRKPSVTASKPARKQAKKK